MTRDRHGLRTSLYRGERFLLGDARAGYSLHRQSFGRARGRWHAVVWSDGGACRSDAWETCEAAVGYALMRARHYGGWSKREVARARAGAGTVAS